MPKSKGHLNPGSPGVALDRFDAAPALADLVRHIWIARWSLPAGEVSRQRVLTYPTFNLVITNGAAAIYGPDPKMQVRELSARGGRSGCCCVRRRGGCFRRSRRSTWWAAAGP